MLWGGGVVLTPKEACHSKCTFVLLRYDMSACYKLVRGKDPEYCKGHSAYFSSRDVDGGTFHQTDA